jgi:signal peptidase I
MEQQKKKKKSSYRDVIEIIAAFVVAFLFYQVLIFATGTRLPVVSVVSDSMYHTSSFDKWWDKSGKFYENLNINKTEFLKFRDFNGLSRGDLLFVMRPDNINIGDIVIYQRDTDSFTIVHRVVKIQGDELTTKGDNNQVTDQPIVKSNTQGKVVFAVPVLGYPRFLLHMLGI